MTNPDDEQLRKARLGVEAESFLQGHLGRYIFERADKEESAHIKDLIEADPDDEKANRDIRNQLQVIHMFRTWITEAINSGRLAEQAIHEQEALENE